MTDERAKTIAGRQQTGKKLAALSRQLWALFKATVRLIDKHGPVMTTLSTIAIAILTGVYVHWSHKQWDVMTGQLGQMTTSGEQTKQLLDLTKQQVNIAKAANDDTHNLLVATQAAVFHLTVDYSQNLNTDASANSGIPFIEVGVTNLGKSPARGFSGQSKYIRRNKAGRVIQSLEHSLGSDVVFPGGGPSTRFPVIPSATDVIDYASETFIVSTRIRYDDGFNSVRNQTFCDEMAVTKKRGLVFTNCGEAKSWEQLVR